MKNPLYRSKSYFTVRKFASKRNTGANLIWWHLFSAPLLPQWDPRMPFIPQGTSPSPMGNAISLLSNVAYNTILYRETPYLPKIPQLPQQHVRIACALLNIGNVVL
jgi:hypothetical protein